jgi:Kazal-type serine protease inhibitor domain
MDVCMHRLARWDLQTAVNMFSRFQFRSVCLRRELEAPATFLVIVPHHVTERKRKWYAAAMVSSIHRVAKWKCSIAGEKNKKLEHLILISLIGLNPCRSQKRNIQAVAAEKCTKKIERCRKSTESACKQISKKQSSIFGNKNDEICGTDSKTYNNECELARATCL